MMSDWVLSVGQLNEYVRRQLAGDPLLRNVRVRGEISGFKRHYSGHLYFSVKDEQARVQCVMFRQNALRLDFEPRDGQTVILSGAASLYAQTGSFQIYCEEMRPEGKGELFRRFEELKDRLSREGLFDPARKKPLPPLPRRIGIITSRSGAALHDMLRVSRRRDPQADILICPASVQGAAAAPEIVRALEMMNKNASCDVILLGRGGGSIEDLWAFNEESVARAIAASDIPVISCVGHETDFTIADFVADVRAATPSMAAELAVPVKSELEQNLEALGRRLDRAQRGRMKLLGVMLDRIALRLGGPVQALMGPRKTRLETLRARLCAAAGTLTAPRQQTLTQLEARMDAALNDHLRSDGKRLDALERTLTALNPGNVLSRGYALVLRDGKVTADAKGVMPGERIAVKMRDGSLEADVLSVKEDKAHGSEEETDV